MKENKDKNIILTYQDLEQSKNGIMGPGRCLVSFLGIFPFVPILLALFSCFIIKIPDSIFRILLFIITFFMLAILLLNIFIWILNMISVFIISEDGELYRIKISSFWYKIKDKMYLINPSGMMSGKFMRLFYMINNIKIVLQSVASDVTYEEFISMGRMEKISEIRNVKVKRKKIKINALIENRRGKKRKNLVIKRVFEKDDIFCEYLVRYESSGINEAAKVDFNQKINAEKMINIDNSPIKHLKKILKFTVTWTCIMAWVAIFTISGDLNRLSRINAGEYVRTEDDKGKIVYISADNCDEYFYESDYGNMYRPVIVVYLSVEFIYVLMKGMDYIIAYKKA